MEFDADLLKKYIEELEGQGDDSNVPLTKSKKSKEPVEQDKPTDKDIEVKKKEKKPRKPKTNAQMEAFNKVRAKRQVILEDKDRKKKIEAGKAYLEDLKKKAPIQEPKPAPKKQVDVESSDEEIVVVKKDKKKKKKQIIIVDTSDSSSSSSSSEEEVVREKKKKNDFGKSHQNKKSIVTVTRETKEKMNDEKGNWKKYFCD